MATVTVTLEEVEGLRRIIFADWLSKEKQMKPSACNAMGVMVRTKRRGKGIGIGERYILTVHWDEIVSFFIPGHVMYAHCANSCDFIRFANKYATFDWENVKIPCMYFWLWYDHIIDIIIHCMFLGFDIIMARHIKDSCFLIVANFSFLTYTVICGVRPAAWQLHLPQLHCYVSFLMKKI